MSSQLHQAVQLAQAGRRDEARYLLWQVIQSDPNSETAWLWMVSVAADQGEYARALHEVLRINPHNQQARQALAQAQPPPQAVPPPPHYAAPPPPYAGPAAAPVPAKPRRSRRRGCGCTGTCLLPLFVFLILPALVCGAISFTSRSLGPFDTLTTYLPGEFGRKTVQVETRGYDFETGAPLVYTLTLSVPRSWFVTAGDDTWWGMWRGVLDRTLPFEAAGSSWRDYDEPADRAVTVLETNPITLAISGAPVGVSLNAMIAADDLAAMSFACTDIRSAFTGSPVTVIAYDRWCGTRQDEIVALYQEGRVFEDFNAPEQVRLITFRVPVDANTAAEWQIILPEDRYGMFERDIAAMIDSAQVVTRPR